MEKNLQARFLEITGRVQGVGFRPFVYRLANKFHLCGYVKNDVNGVVVFIEGQAKDIDLFMQEIYLETPPLSEIVNIAMQKKEPLYSKEFKIVHDESATQLKTAIISPDFAICDDCKKDILKKNHKYSNYFATNCTNCGPRYTIIKTVPYDRENTSMAKFTMCESCQNEYSNPLNRRYHAQPISCNMCGPSLDGTIRDIVQKIKSGAIVAIKGIGGFHIVCDATNDESVQRLREAKNRPSKPFALMCKDIKQIQSFSIVTPEEETLLKSKEAPVVILKKKILLDSIISNDVAPNIERIGCFLPYTPLHCLMFTILTQPIVATSANYAGEPIITTKEELEKKLPFVEAILDFDRDIVNGIDDSVAQIVAKKVQLLRVARGYAPKTIKLPYKLNKKILAVGANQKNSIALAFDDQIIISPYIGDLNSIRTFEFFLRTVQTFKNFYDFEADILLCDKHPQYETTKWVKKQNKKSYSVQHHLAHIYAAKAEYGLESDYLGFSFDGTGYGDDGLLWGGEVFVGDKRKYHFKPLKLLGGEKAIKEPRRVALSMLFESYSLDEVLKKNLPFSLSEIEVLHQSYQKNLNAPLSTSVGRLFDGVASLSELCHFQSYEGEAGLLCEMRYNKDSSEFFNYTIVDGEIAIEFDFFDKEIVTKFMNTLVEIVVSISKKESLDVILSGGVFQNKTLLELIIKRLNSENIKYYYQQKTSINDGGIALGQIFYYLQHYSCKN